MATRLAVSSASGGPQALHYKMLDSVESVTKLAAPEKQPMPSYGQRVCIVPLRKGDGAVDSPVPPTAGLAVASLAPKALRPRRPIGVPNLLFLHHEKLTITCAEGQRRRMWT